MFRPKLFAILALAIAASVILYFVRFSPSARKAAYLKRGETYFQAKDYERAKLEYTNVIRIAPAERLAFDRMGAMWLDQGAPIQAIPYLQRVKGIAASDVENRRKLAEAFLALRDLAGARGEALEILKQLPNDDQAWMCLTDALWVKSDIDELEQRLADVTSKSVGHEYAAATLAIIRGDRAKAEEALARALALNPNVARLHLRLAEIRLASGDRERGKEALAAAAVVAPVRSREKLRYPDFLAQNGGVADARAAVAGVLAQAPDFFPAAILEARIEFRQKAIPAALAALQPVFQRDVGNPEARILEAQILIAKGDSADAVAALERLAKVYPNAAMVRYEMGRAYALAGRGGEASSSLRQAIALAPAMVEAKLALAELELRGGQPEAAVELLRSALAQSRGLPNMQGAQTLLAVALRAAKRFDDAAAIYRQQALASPQNAEPLVALAQVLRDQRKLEEAQNVLERALQLAPANLNIVASLVDLDLFHRRYDVATARLDKLDEKQRASAEAKVMAARILGAQKLWPAAEEALLKAIELNPESDAAYQLLVALYYENKRLEDAVKRLVEKLQKTPKDLGSRILLARLYEEQKDYENARAAYEEILRQQPDAFVPLNNLAYLLAEHLNEAARAEELARKARGLQPGNPLVADTLGWILYRRGDYEAAANLIQESAARLAESDPNGNVPAEVSCHLGIALAATGNFDQAKVALTKAVSAPADFPSKAEAAARLELLNATPGAAELEKLQKLAAEKPADPVVQLKFANALEAAGKLPDAAAAYEAALKANPKLPWAAAGLARVSATTDPAKATVFAKMARALAPSDAKIAATIGAAVARTGDLQWAYSLLQQGSAGNAASPSELLEFASVAYRLGKISEARQSLDRAAASGESTPLVAEVRSFQRMLDLIDKPVSTPEADAEITAVLAKDPKNLPALMAQAASKEAARQLPAALAAYEAILQLAPGFPLAQARLAALLLETGGSPDRARELAEACRALLPDNPTAVLVLGETAYQKGEYTRAVSLLTEASRTKPLDAKRLFLLGASHLQAKNTERAKEFLTQAVAAGLAEPQLAQASKMLAELPK